MTNHESIQSILEGYLIYPFDQELTNQIAQECGQFLIDVAGVNENVVKYCSIEFEVSSDQSCIHVFGGNLITCLWIIDIFPKNPEKYISGKEYIFQDKKYIYEPFKKILKVKKWRNKK